MTGSDGLWDNIFAEEAATIASKCRDKGETATTAAQVLCRWAGGWSGGLAGAWVENRLPVAAMNGFMC